MGARLKGGQERDQSEHLMDTRAARGGPNTRHLRRGGPRLALICLTGQLQLGRAHRSWGVSSGVPVVPWGCARGMAGRRKEFHTRRDQVPEPKLWACVSACVSETLP